MKCIHDEKLHKTTNEKKNVLNNLSMNILAASLICFSDLILMKRTAWIKSYLYRNPLMKHVNFLTRNSHKHVQLFTFCGWKRRWSSDISIVFDYWKKFQFPFPKSTNARSSHVNMRQALQRKICDVQLFKRSTSNEFLSAFCTNILKINDIN